jgi:hypothetical protein
MIYFESIFMNTNEMYTDSDCVHVISIRQNDGGSPQRRIKSQGADPPPFLLRVATAGKNYLKEEITPLLLTRIGERCSQTISNLGHAVLLRRCELPL